MSALVIRLPAQPVTSSTEFEYVLSRDGTTMESHGAAPAAVLPAAGRAGTELVAVVPVEMTSWHRVELPKGTSAASPRLRAVLEGLLEDQLLDEPESLHFAVQPQARTGSPLWVAVCDRHWLRSAMQVLESVERPVARIVPEFAPEGEPVLYVIGDPARPQLVAAGAEGVAALPLSGPALGLLPPWLEGAPCVAEPSVAALAEQVLQRQPTLLQAPQRWLQSAQSAWDLAQFDLSSSGRARAWKKLGTAGADLLAAPQWKAARWGAIVLLALNVLGLNAWAWRERSALDDKREMARQALTRTFPQVKVVVDAPVQMEREVAALRQRTGATSGRDLEAMLAALGTALPAPRALSGLDYSGGELRVKGLGVSPDEARALAAALKRQGYSTTVQDGTLVIAAAGS
jgi:general secretion pathway protein L